MIGVREVTVISGALAARPRGAGRRLENTGYSSLSRDRVDREDTPSPRAGRHRPCLGSSRFGTESTPRCEGPPLCAAFVAQVLGQMLPGRQDNLKQANAAYSALPPLAGQLLDETV